MDIFKSLLLKPFLYLSEYGSTELRKIYTQKTRSLHPDLKSFGDDSDSRIAAEQELAVINSCYKKIKDPWTLTELAFKDSQSQETTGSSSRGKMQGEYSKKLSAEYFELQELIAEEGPDSRLLLGKMTELKAKLAKCMQSLKHKRLEMTSSFPFLGTVDSVDFYNSWRWEENLKEKALEICSEYKFLSRMKSDIQGRFGHNAHSD